MKILLHSCCGPCSTAVIDKLKNEHDLTIYYYNPNIDTQEEYQLRLAEQMRYCNALGIKVIAEEHNPNDFLSQTKVHGQDSHCVNQVLTNLYSK